MAYNPLEDHPEVRKTMYVIQWLFNGVMGAVAVVLLILSKNPQWFIIATAVLNFVWGYTGLTASANTPVDEFPED